jgi:hypothetical protein
MSYRLRPRGPGLLVIAVAACHAPAAPTAPPPPAPRVACASCTGPRRVSGSDLALAVGRWLGSDREQWRYDLDVGIDGTFTQTVHQDSGTVCVQEGRVDVQDSQVVRTFTGNDCNTAYVGETVRDEVVTLDGDRMVVRTDSGYEIEYQRAR